ncbi:MAG: NAD(P)-dependent oxidoreductase [Clostridia bacterium]
MNKEIENVFIAGGTGFLGYHSALEFLKLKINVDTIALPNEINLDNWFPKEIGLQTGNLFEMTNEELEKMFSVRLYDVFVYALGPDDRVVPKAPAYPFFYEKLVVQCKRICECAKKANIKRCIILGSYFTLFDKKENGELSKFHPYIKARAEQEKQLIKLGDSKFSIMILQLPYIFGTMPNRKPLWKEHFLDRFNSMKNIMFPNNGGTAVVDVSDVSKAVVATAFYGKNKICYPVGNKNMMFKDLILTMLKQISPDRKFVGVPAFLCALGTKKLVNKEKSKNLESGLNIPKLMTQILCKKFFIDPTPTQKELNYLKLGFKSADNLDEIIIKTVAQCCKK